MLTEIQYFPAVDFFSKMKAFDPFSIEQFEHYQKGGLRNRCFILASNGRLPLSVPLKKGKNSQQPIRDVRISYDVNWQLQHWLSIQSAYGKSTYYSDYEAEVKQLFNAKPEFLFEYNLLIIDTLLNLMQLPLQYRLTEKFEGSVIEVGKVSHQSTESTSKPYPQVFSDRFDFVANLSVLDLLFNTGPEAFYYL